MEMCIRLPCPRFAQTPKICTSAARAMTLSFRTSNLPRKCQSLCVPFPSQRNLDSSVHLLSQIESNLAGFHLHRHVRAVDAGARRTRRADRSGSYHRGGLLRWNVWMDGWSFRRRRLKRNDREREMEVSAWDKAWQNSRLPCTSQSSHTFLWGIVTHTTSHITASDDLSLQLRQYERNAF